MALPANSILLDEKSMVLRKEYSGPRIDEIALQIDFSITRVLSTISERCHIKKSSTQRAIRQCLIQEDSLFSVEHNVLKNEA